MCVGQYIEQLHLPSIQEVSREGEQYLFSFSRPPDARPGTSLYRDDSSELLSRVVSAHYCALHSHPLATRSRTSPLQGVHSVLPYVVASIHYHASHTHPLAARTGTSSP